MAYADGELDAAAREAVEAAMREDPQIAARIARHRPLRLQVQGAYPAELSEEVPQRLLTAAKGAAAGGAAAKGAADTEGKVVNLRGPARARVDRDAPHRRRWRTMGSLAASVIAGVAVGFLIWGRAGSPFVRGAGGELLARGQLAQALSSQLVAEQTSRSGGRVGVGRRMPPRRGVAGVCPDKRLPRYRQFPRISNGCFNHAGGHSDVGRGANCRRASGSGGGEGGASARLDRRGALIRGASQLEGCNAA